MVILTQARRTFRHWWINVVPTQTGQQDLKVVLQQNGIDNINDLLCTPDTWQETQAYTASRVTTTDGTQHMEQLNLKNFDVNQIFMIKDYIWNVVRERGYTSASDMTMTRDDYMALSRSGPNDP